MIIKARRQFKEDYQKLIESRENTAAFRKAFNKAIFLLETDHQDFSKTFTVNRLVKRGEGWFDCYVYDDIIMIYKIEGQYIKLSRLGTPQELEKTK